MTAVRVDLPRRLLGQALRRMTFHQQLSLAVGLGVLCVTLLASVASAWQASRLTRLNLLQQGLRVTASLAQQSRLALLTGTADNVGEALSTTLAFPDVLRVEVRSADGQLLAAQGPLIHAEAPTNEAPPSDREAPYLIEEGAESWRFAASVWFMPDNSSPYDVKEIQSERLGQVQVVFSKGRLSQTVTDIFLVNVLSSVVIAVIFLGILRLFSTWLTRPLSALSKAMGRAEQGEVDVRVPAQGPVDLQRMSLAFNRMIAALQERGEELQRHRDHLELLVCNRTAELQVAKERAEVASQAKTDFLTRMSHELRTPLNAVMGYAQILQMDNSLSARQLHILRTIHDSGDHLLNLIVDILDLSRIEAGRTELAPSDCKLRGMVSMLDDLMRLKAAEKQLSFVAFSGDGVPDGVRVDERRLRQVLLNLLGNAIKFTASGHVGLTVSVMPGEPADSEVPSVRLRFEVEDTGPGIAPQDQARIFEPFEQAGDSRSRAAGTGLGLAISRSLVRLMGGELHLESQVGQGSRFWFELELPECVDLPAPQLADEACITGYSGPRRRILIADDVPANRQLLAAMLQPLGFDTAEALHGQDALDQVQAALPDLVLMDVAMPVLDGLAATRQLRSAAATQALPIIAITAHASAQHREQAQAAGASDFIPKPFDRSELLDKMARLLGLDWITTTTFDTGTVNTTPSATPSTA